MQCVCDVQATVPHTCPLIQSSQYCYMECAISPTLPSSFQEACNLFKVIQLWRASAGIAITISLVIRLGVLTSMMVDAYHLDPLEAETGESHVLGSLEYLPSSCLKNLWKDLESSLTG